MPKNTRYEILTPEGFKDFTDVVYKGYKSCLEITTSSGKTIKCTNNHKIFVTDDYCINAKFLKIGDQIMTKDGRETISNITRLEDKELVFDIVNVGDKNRFFANGITVHNCLDEFAFIPRNIQEDHDRAGTRQRVAMLCKSLHCRAYQNRPRPLRRCDRRIQGVPMG